jgi:hypothetical protein
MAGYSGTPLPKKLGIKEGHRLVLVGAPAGFARTLGALPLGVTVTDKLAGKTPVDVIVFFTTERADFAKRLSSLRQRMAQNAGLWIAFPKKASRMHTSMTDHVIRDVALPTGLVDNKVCAIDDTWTGVRLVIRLTHRTE